MSDTSAQRELVKPDAREADDGSWTPILASINANGMRAADGVYSTAELQHFVKYERLKAARNGEPNAMLVCNLNGSAGNRRVARNVVKTITRTVRDTDHVGWINEHEVGVLLSGTSQESASVLQRRLEVSFSSPEIEIRVEDL